MTVQDKRVKYIGIRVEPELHERFREAAKASHRSMEGELKALMERRVREVFKEAA